MEIFNDRVEVSNPGGLISGIPKNEFGKRSLSRNLLIFGLFERVTKLKTTQTLKVFITKLNK